MAILNKDTTIGDITDVYERLKNGGGAESSNFTTIELPTTYTSIIDAAVIELAVPSYGIQLLHLKHSETSEEYAVCIQTKNNDTDNCVSQLLITSTGIYRRWYPESESSLVTDPEYTDSYPFRKLAIPDELDTETYTGTIPSGKYYTTITNVGGDVGRHIIKTINVTLSSAPVLTSFNKNAIYVSRMPGDATTSEVTFSITYHTAILYQEAKI